MASIIRVSGKWRAQVRRKGSPTETKTFARKAAAEQWAAQIETKVQSGYIRKPKTGTTIGQMVQRYLNERDPDRMSRSSLDALQRIQRVIGHEVAAELNADKIVGHLLKSFKSTNTTSAQILAYMGTLWRVSRVIWKEPVDRDAVKDAKEYLLYHGRLSYGGKRDRRLEKGEYEKIIAQLTYRHHALTKDFIDFAIATCFRPPSEITRLRWDEINHEDKTILIRDRKDPREKYGNNQTVPLLNGSYEIIMRQKRKSEFIFPHRNNSMSHAFANLIAKTDIQDLHLYDLRHEAISRLVESRKYDIPEMMLITGHKDPKQLMRYTQLRAKDLHR